MSRRIYIKNLAYDTSIQDLRKLVTQFAPVDSIVIPRDAAHLPRGFAYVFLKSEADVDKVIDYIDGRHLKQRQLR